jgi:hypothetical protein
MIELIKFFTQNRNADWLTVNVKLPIVNSLRAIRDIGWEIVGLLNPSAWNKTRPIVVTFTGGMGAQIISAAIYFLLKKEGQKVYADLSYFEKSSRVAIEGIAGDVSQWEWQLKSFSIFPESFEKLPNINRSKYKIIRDGKNKSSLGMKALNTASIHQYFIVEEGVEDILPEGFIQNYLCIHVRRGDYVNVATYMVADDDFIEMANKFSGLVSNIVIVSDSLIPETFRRAICDVYKNALFLDKVNAVIAHRVMRNARVLICSNSQFSLVAALLNKRALVFLPKKWFGDKHQKLGTPINDLCGFQILKSN